MLIIFDETPVLLTKASAIIPSSQVEVEYVVASSDEDIYFLNANMRQNLKTDKETMFHTTLQKIFSVLNCKTRMEKVHGPLSSLANPYQVFIHIRTGHGPVQLFNEHTKLTLKLRCDGVCQKIW